MATTKVTTDVIDMSGNTGGLTWVKGTTAQRTTTTIGDLRETPKLSVLKYIPTKQAQPNGEI